VSVGDRVKRTGVDGNRSFHRGIIGAARLILTQTGKTAACKLRERPKWILSAAEEIRFAGH
jgi:hypothetical protein